MVSSEDEEGGSPWLTHLKGQVLPSIQLPTAEDDTSDAESTSGSEINLVFSSINWDATSPTGGKPAAAPIVNTGQAPAQQVPSPATSPLAPRPAPTASAQSSPAKFSIWKPGTSPAPSQSQSHGSHVPVEQESESDESSPDISPRCPVVPGKYAAALNAVAGQSQTTTPRSPSAGSSWLSGAAGRLSDLTTPRSQARASMQQEVSQGASDLVPGASSAADQEAEALATHHFNTTIEQCAGQQVPSDSRLVLEDDVAGIALQDLDHLIAQLQTGRLVLNLDATRPAHLPDPDSLFTDSEDEDDGGLIKAAKDEPVIKSKQPVHPVTTPQAGALKPAAATVPAALLQAPAMSPSGAKPAQPSSAQPASPATVTLPPHVPPSLLPQSPAATSAPPVLPPAATPAPIQPTFQPVPSAGPPGGLPHPMGALPPRFRMWANLPGSAATTTAAAGGGGNTGDAAAAGPAPAPAWSSSTLQSPGAADTRRTVVVDLRQSINQIQSAQAAKAHTTKATVATGPAANEATGSAKPCTAGAGKTSTATACQAGPTTRSTFVGTGPADSTCRGQAMTADGNGTAVTRDRGVSSTGSAVAASTPAVPQTKSVFVEGGPPPDPSPSLDVQPSSLRHSRAPEAGACPANFSAGGGLVTAPSAANLGQPTPPPPPGMHAAQVDTEGLLPPSGPHVASSGISRWAGSEVGPGVAKEEGVKAVKAGMCIRLPAGPPVTVPSPQTADACIGGDSPLMSRHASEAGTGAAAGKVGSHALGADSNDDDDEEDNDVSVAAAGRNTAAATNPSSNSGNSKLAVGSGKDVPRAELTAEITSHTSTPATPPPPPPQLPASPQPPTTLNLPSLPDPAVGRGHVFTLVLSSPDGLATPTLARVLQWLVSCQVQGDDNKKTTTLDDPCISKPPAFTIQGFRLLQLPCQHTLIQGLPGLGSPAQGLADCFTRGQVQPGSEAAGRTCRVLVVACEGPELVEAEGMDVISDHQKPPGADQDLNCVVKRFRCWLKGQAWGNMIKAASVPTTNQLHPVVPVQWSSCPISDWVDCLDGNDYLTNLDKLPTTVNQLVLTATRPEVQPDNTLLVSILPQGGLASPQLLSNVLSRVSAMGLTAVGLRTVHPDAPAVSYLNSRTSHKVLPGVPAVAVALSGNPTALQRWRADLGGLCSDLAGLSTRLGTEPPGRPHSPQEHTAIPTVSPNRRPSSQDPTSFTPWEQDLAQNRHFPFCKAGLNPSHLHAPPVLSCSYDTKAAASDAGLLFRTSTASGLSSTGLNEVDVRSDATAGAQQLASPTAGITAQIALAASTTAEVLAAVQVAAQLAASGFTLSSMVRTSTPADACFTQLLPSNTLGTALATPQQPPLPTHQPPTPSAVLAVEIQGLECREQLQLALLQGAKRVGCGHATQATGPVGAAGVAGPGIWVAGLHDAQPSGAGQQQQLLPKQATKLPPLHETQAVVAAVEQLLSSVASKATSGVPESSMASVVIEPQQQQHLDPHDAGQDQVLAVYVQGATPAVLLATQAILHACVAPRGGDSDVAGLQGCSCAIEVVAMRAVTHNLPGAVAQLLHPCVSMFSGSGSGGSRAHRQSDTDAGSAVQGTVGAGGRVSNSGGAAVIPGAGSLACSQATHSGVLLVLHGPDARQIVTAVLAAVASAAHPSWGTTGRVSGCGTELPGQLQAVLGGLVREHVTAAVGHVGHVAVSVSATHVEACKVLATCFAESTQVHLDPSFHNGVTRASLSHVCETATSATMHLAASPHVHDTFLTVPLQPPGRPAGEGRPALAALYRAFKVLHKMGCVLVAARTLTQLPADDPAAKCLQQPELGNKPVVLLWLRANNAVPRVYAAMHQAGLQGKVFPATSWRSSQQLIKQVWPASASLGQPTSSPQCEAQGRAELPAQDTTCLLLLPPTWQPRAASGRGQADLVSKVLLDLGQASEVLGMAVGDGFVLSVCHATTLTADLLAAAVKTCQATDPSNNKPFAMQAKGWSTGSAAKANQAHHAATDAADCLMLLLQRSNAVAQLQLSVERHSASAADKEVAGSAGGGVIAVARSNHLNELLTKAGVPAKLA